jgi:hypothetical protein
MYEKIPYQGCDVHEYSMLSVMTLDTTMILQNVKKYMDLHEFYYNLCILGFREMCYFLLFSIVEI